MVSSSTFTAAGATPSNARNLADKINSLDPSIQDRYTQTAVDFLNSYSSQGYQVTINQASRTSAEQRAIQATGVKAASPKNTWHTVGGAADFTVTLNGVADKGTKANNAYQALLAPIANANGLANPIKNDVGHFMPAELPKARGGRSIAQFIEGILPAIPAADSVLASVKDYPIPTERPQQNTLLASLTNVPTPTSAQRPLSPLEAAPVSAVEQTQLASLPSALTPTPVSTVERGILSSLFSQPSAQAAEQTSSYPAHAFDPEMGIPRDAPNFHVNMAPGNASNPLAYLTPVVNPMMPESIRTPGWWNTSAPSFPDMPAASGMASNGSLAAPDQSRFAAPRTAEEIAQAQSILGGLFSQPSAAADPTWVSTGNPFSGNPVVSDSGQFANLYSDTGMPAQPEYGSGLVSTPYTSDVGMGLLTMPMATPAATIAPSSQSDIMAAKTSESVTDAEYAAQLRSAGLSETEIAMAVAARSAAAPVAPVAAPVAAPPLAAPKTVKQYNVAAHQAPATPAPQTWNVPSAMDVWQGKSSYGMDSEGGTVWNSGGENYRYSPLSDKVWQVGENGQGIPVYGDIPLPSQGSTGGINLPSKDRLISGGKNILGKGAGGLLGSALLGPVGGLLGAALGGKLTNGGINGLLGGNKNTFPPAPNAYPARPVAPYGGGASSTYSQADIQRAYDLGGQAFGDAVAGGAQGLW